MQDLPYELLEQVRLADLIDVAIVAVLVYVVLVWLRGRASRSVGVVVLGSACLFFLARWLDLYLTTMVFHYGLVTMLLALVIVFQNDIRHGFERLATHTWLRPASQAEHSQIPIDAVVESVADMARQRIGALIVFPGRQPLERHLRGGVEVDAKISKPLLLSIFHPESPGHDGAILLADNRVSQLGVQLPLTLNVHKVQDCGTRHAAALGLAECSDAIVVVVSEERGVITIAHEGELEEVEPAVLADRLRHHVDLRAGNVSSPATIRRNLLTKAMALATAVSLWFLFAYHTDTIQRTIVVPIEYRNLPPKFELVDPKPTHAELTLSGSQPAFAMLDVTALTISLDAKQVTDSQILRWQTSSSLTNLPSELSIERVRPETVVVAFRTKD